MAPAGNSLHSFMNAAGPQLLLGGLTGDVVPQSVGTLFARWEDATTQDAGSPKARWGEAGSGIVGGLPCCLANDVESPPLGDGSATQDAGSPSARWGEAISRGVGGPACCLASAFGRLATLGGGSAAGPKLDQQLPDRAGGPPGVLLPETPESDDPKDQKRPGSAGAAVTAGVDAALGHWEDAKALSAWPQSQHHVGALPLPPTALRPLWWLPLECVEWPLCARGGRDCGAAAAAAREPEEGACTVISGGHPAQPPTLQSIAAGTLARRDPVDPLLLVLRKQADFGVFTAAATWVLPPPPPAGVPQGEDGSSVAGPTSWLKTYPEVGVPAPPCCHWLLDTSSGGTCGHAAIPKSAQPSDSGTAPEATAGGVLAATVGHPSSVTSPAAPVPQSKSKSARGLPSRSFLDLWRRCLSDFSALFSLNDGSSPPALDGGLGR